MFTLYRKYRPQKFSEVVGQNHIKIILQNEIEANKIAHAYLFCGPRAVGKTTLARVFAKAINCQNRKDGEFEPCNKCNTCKDITDGRNLDIIEIDAASHTGVDNVRENIISNARIAPTTKYKVFIIDEVHMLSISSFNALLKIIEEPPQYVVFILCTTEIHKVPATIISRCQRFDFRRINLEEIAKKLTFIVQSENIKINQEIIEKISKQSEGHMRDAESILGQILAISEKAGSKGERIITNEAADLVIPTSDLNEAINLIEFYIKKDSASAISLINKLVDSGIDLKLFTKDLIELLRKILLTKINPALGARFSMQLNNQMELKVSTITANLSIEKVLKFIDLLSLALQEIKTSFIIQLPLEIVSVEICSSPTSSDINVKLSAQTKKNNETNNMNEKEELQNSKSVNLNNGSINFKFIKEKWNEVLIMVKKYNHSLSFILKVCEPKNLNDNELCLAFKYKFHKERVSDPQIKNIIEKILEEVYGLKIKVTSIVDENIIIAENSQASGEENKYKKVDNSPTDNSKDVGVVDNMLKIFGGKIIN